MDLYIAQKRFLEVLTSPFPGNCDITKELRINLIIGLFVALFLYFFQPYGMSGYQGSMILLASWFGLATFIGSFLYFVVLTYIFNIRQDAPGFTFGKWLIFVFFLIIVITLCNFIVFWILTEGNIVFSWRNLISLFIKTAAIGFFPISISGLLIYFNSNSKYTREASEIHFQPAKADKSDKSANGDLINIPSQYSDDFTCEIDKIYSFESQDNYVAIRHLSGDSIKTTLIRNSLSAIESILPAEVFLRCHRSFITNLQKIDKVDGNAQGLVLTLKDGGPTIPVSRSYIGDLKQQIKRLA